ncbi:hypothetical protein HGRIS_013174 [Hohenbuehelia grisea]|uniref:Fe2OG dioxygenase domain-containing protein n=1 Tax=Hohenbuehelia grisea TaxID=104357 RepID=A0ABR3IUN4_9AGAR
MPPKSQKSKVSSTTSRSNRNQGSTTPQKPVEIQFPAFATKRGLECRVLLQDQILLIDNFMTQSECQNFVKFIDSLPLELTPRKRPGEAERVNHRFSVSSPEFAEELHKRLLPHLPSFPYPASTRKTQTVDPRLPNSCNSNIRVYKYTPSQLFGPHYDDSVRDPQSGHTSEWTLLIYLTGHEDGIKGGETIFYKDGKGRNRDSVVAPLTRGTALLHRHGNECLLHEGSPVESGTKYVLRSDLMFAK